jgi:hypothetical protein
LLSLKITLEDHIARALNHPFGGQWGNTWKKEN